jgi:hypothetical protein
MASIQFQTEPPKKKEASTTTAFHYDGNKQSQYQKDGKAMTWLQVQAEVGEGH